MFKQWKEYDPEWLIKVSEWQFQESITVEESPEGEIVIDIIKTNRVGGIEFLARVMGE